MKNSIFGGVILISLLVFGMASSYSGRVFLPLRKAEIITGHGNVNTLEKRYTFWKKAYAAKQGAEVLTLPLRFSKVLGTQQSEAQGITQINLLNGKFQANLSGLKTGANYAFWLVGGSKNKPNQTLEIKLGVFKAISNQDSFSTQLNRTELQDFFIQQIVLNHASEAHATSAIIAGNPSLFQRLFYADQLWPITGVGHITQSKSESPFTFLIPKPVLANNAPEDLVKLMGQQIAMGRELFINETFAGNGRTCSTCHRLDNNHTLDPKYIAKLPKEDPLFVAETNPELKGLENTNLMRQFGLILANVDGFDKPGVFRSVQHLLALANSITPEADKEGKQIINAIGWSGDGAPGDGSLRMFSAGAVIQHFTKSLKRNPTIDFRLPNDAELDALEAYMLSLGRTEEPDLDHLYFSSPLVQRGRELFHSKDNGTAQCKGCHFNAGANSFTTFQNGNRDTGVANMPENPARLIWKPMPEDGGFGRNERHNCGWDHKQTCFGNGEFNVPSLIEAADTGPFFHNNAVNTLEEAIAFYNSNAFHDSPGANPIDLTLIPPRKTCDRCTHLESTQIVSVALFLRTLNAMENIRGSNELVKQVQSLGISSGRELLKLAMADTEDAIEVLEDGLLIANPESLKQLKQALKLEQTAMDYSMTDRRNLLLEQAMTTKIQANDLLLTTPPAPSSLK